MINVIKIQNNLLQFFFLLDHPFGYLDCEYVNLDYVTPYHGTIPSWWKYNMAIVIKTQKMK
jgi:hypothetical protein